MHMRAQTSAELQAIAAEFVHSMSPGLAATLVTLSGDLGAGKTTFVQGAARSLGITETVSSPTFVIQKTYMIDVRRRSFAQLVHIDAYRLNSAHELEVLGWHELLTDSGNLIILEWPERVLEAIPKSAISLRFDFENEGRIITSTYGEKESGDQTSS